MPSSEAGRHSPTPSLASEAGGAATAGGGGGGGGRRKGKGRRRGGRHSEAAQTVHHAPAAPVATSSGAMNWREEILESKKQNPHDK